MVEQMCKQCFTESLEKMIHSFDDLGDLLNHLVVKMSNPQVVQKAPGHHINVHYYGILILNWQEKSIHYNEICMNRHV